MSGTARSGSPTTRRQAIGRANPQVLELNSVVETGGTDLDVLQSGDTVLLVDRAENRLEIVDPATSTVSDTVALPPDRPEVLLAGDRVVVHERGTGEVWIVPLAGLAGIRCRVGGDPQLRARRRRAQSPPTGLLWAYSPSVAEPSSGCPPPPPTTCDSTHDVTIGSAGDSLSITSVAGRWAVLDSTTEQLFLDGRVVDLAAPLGNGSGRGTARAEPHRRRGAASPTPTAC